MKNQGYIPPPVTAILSSPSPRSLPSSSAVMTGRRKAKTTSAAPSSTSTSSLAAQMGGLGLNPSAASGSGAPSAAGADPPAAGRKGTGTISGNQGDGGGVGPSSSAASPSAPSSSTLVATAGPPKDAPPSSPADKKEGGKMACAGCCAYGGKTFRCSHCLLVFYCSKNCQASDRWSSIALVADRNRLFLLFHLSPPACFIFSPRPHLRLSNGGARSVFFAHSPPFHPAH